MLRLSSWPAAETDQAKHAEAGLHRQRIAGIVKYVGEGRPVGVRAFAGNQQIENAEMPLLARGQASGRGVRATATWASAKSGSAASAC